MNDIPLTSTVYAPVSISDPLAFTSLGVSSAGNITYTGNNEFNYFPADFDTNENADVEHFVDPELREALGLPDPDEAEEEEDNEPPIPTWTSTPKEMVRASSDPIVLSTTPDVAKTPVGSSTPPIAYSTHADPADDTGYASSVFATQDRVMTMDSAISVTQGAEQGTAKGFKSGTINDITEAQQHSSNVRVEGAYVIRHLDRATMNNGNNFGEFVYVEDVTTHSTEAEEPPEEEPGFWGGLWDEAKDLNEEYKILQRGVGAMQTGFGAVEAIAGGAVVVGSGIGTVFSGGTATPVMVVTAVGGGALAAKGSDDVWAGLKTIWTGEIHDTVLDGAVADVSEGLGASEGVTTVLQGAAGAVGNPGNIATEITQATTKIVMKNVDDVAEAAIEATGKNADNITEGTTKAAGKNADDATEETAKKNARASQNCYAAAMAAIVIARANGVKYVGGPHNGVKKGSQKGVYESHHMPPKRTGGLTEGRGPAILMDYDDHLATQTWGNSNGNRNQRTLAGGGKLGFLRALASDVLNVKSIAQAANDPHKYDKAIEMTEAYAGCLAASGGIK